MKASRFSGAQKAFILNRAMLGSRSRTFAARPGSARRPTSIGRRSNDGLLPTEMRRLKQLEDENDKLKKLVADLSLDKEMLQDVIRRKL